MARGVDAMTQDLVAALRAKVDAALVDIVDLSRPVALLDYPDHGNPGDAAIWLGTTEWLARHGADVAYVSHWETFSPRAIKRRIGRGTLLFHGGGNFGPLYVEHHRFREQVIESFPDHPVVLMPQTLEFSADAMVRESARFLARFPRLWALGRDHRSAEILAAHLGERARLCPDMAFCLSPRLPDGEPDFDFVALTRTDREAGDGKPLELPNAWATDWITSRWKRRDQRLRYNAAIRATNLSGLLTSTLPFDLNSRFVLREGLRIVGRGRVVVSDRLHVHILSVLLGKPHVLMDNSYGKLSAFRETWTAEAPRALWAEDPADARDKALNLLAATRG